MNPLEFKCLDCAEIFSLTRHAQIACPECGSFSVDDYHGDECERCSNFARPGDDFCVECAAAIEIEDLQAVARELAQEAQAAQQRHAAALDLLIDQLVAPLRAPTLDIKVMGEGSAIGLFGASLKGREWLRSHVGSEEMIIWADQRMAPPIIGRAEAFGLVVRS